jgi:hypothetical protein
MKRWWRCDGVASRGPLGVTSCRPVGANAPDELPKCLPLTSWDVLTS